MPKILHRGARRKVEFYETACSPLRLTVDVRDAFIIEMAHADAPNRAGATPFAGGAQASPPPTLPSLLTPPRPSTITTLERVRNRTRVRKPFRYVPFRPAIAVFEHNLKTDAGGGRRRGEGGRAKTRGLNARSGSALRAPVAPLSFLGPQPHPPDRFGPLAFPPCFPRIKVTRRSRGVEPVASAPWGVRGAKTRGPRSGARERRSAPAAWVAWRHAGRRHASSRDRPAGQSWIPITMQVPRNETEAGASGDGKRETEIGTRM